MIIFDNLLPNFPHISHGLSEEKIKNLKKIITAIVIKSKFQTFYSNQC